MQLQEIRRTEAHRTQMIRTITKTKEVNKKRPKVAIDRIKNDQSASRVVSHKQLQSLCSRDDKIFKSDLYIEEEITTLFSTYGVVYRSSFNKSKLK